MKTQRQPTCRRITNGGFSFLETVLVLALIGLCAGITMPSIQNWQRRLPMERAVSILQVQLQNARASAIRSGQPWCLLLPSSGTAGYLETLRHPGNAQGKSKRIRFDWPAEISCSIESSQILHRPKELIEIKCVPDGVVVGMDLKLSDRFGTSTLIRISRITGTATLVTHESSVGVTSRHQ